MVDGKEVAIFNVSGTFYAIDNVCLHVGGPLGEGFLEGEIVTCPLHGWQYNVATGEVILNPEMRVPTYQVKVENGKIMVAVS
jgi:nitrite reductase/ring-hydroxylating ferredoxin subunit